MKKKVNKVEKTNQKISKKYSKNIKGGTSDSFHSDSSLSSTDTMTNEYFKNASTNGR